MPAVKKVVRHKPEASPQNVSTTLERNSKVCICCNPAENVRPVSEFFNSTSPLHADGLVPICKKCIVQHSFDYRSGAIDMDGFLDVLRQIDKPYLPEVVTLAWKQFDETYDLAHVKERTRLDNLDKVILYYFKALKDSPSYRRYRWIDGAMPEAGDDAEDVPITNRHGLREVKAKPSVVTDDMKLFWGPGFSNEDYVFLQHEFDEWVKDQGGMPDSKSQIEILKNLCMSRLQTLRGMVSGDGNMSATLKSFNESLTLGNLKPTEKKSGTENPLGVVIRDITNFTPPDFYKDKELFRDYSGIEEYIERFVLRPMRNTMFGEREEDKEFTVMDSDDTAE